MPSSSHTGAEQQRKETISACFIGSPTVLATDSEAQAGSQMEKSGATSETARQSRLVQLEEDLLDLEPPGNPFSSDTCDDETEKEFEFIWATTGPLYRLADVDSDGIGHHRMSDAYDIVKKYMWMNLGIEQLLARVHLIRTENSDVGFRLNRDLYSGFMSMLREWKSRAQVSLEANGVPRLALPTWGLSNDITEWISYSDLELFGISFRAQTENLLFQLDKYHERSNAVVSTI